MFVAKTKETSKGLEKYRPRLSIEITEEQAAKLYRLVPWGVKKEMFSVIIDDVIKLLETHGEILIAAILTRKLKMQDLPTVKEALHGDNR